MGFDRDQERLQPALLDRLSDEAPERQVEERVAAVMTAAQLRSAVLRDLNWLLNTTRVESLLDLSRTPMARKSTLNYGMPDIAGRTVSGLDPESIAEEIRRSILDFEPRLTPSALRVTPVPDKLSNRLAFRIEAELWAQPLPLRLWLRTELDVDSGDVAVTELDEPGLA